MRITSILALASLAVLVGCSSSSSSGGATDGGTDGGGSGPTADQACTDYAKAVCDRAAKCSAALIQSSFGDAAACNASVKSDCLATLGAPSTSTTPTIAATCVPAITAMTCGDLFTGNTPAVCRVPGKLADGAACGADAQCVTDYCSTTSTSICGTCGKAPAAGEACDTKKCGPGLTCTSNKCAAPIKSGAACDGTLPCEFGTGCTDGKCAALAATAGAACAADGKGAPPCDLFAGLFCEPTSKKCKAFKFAGGGETCGYDATASDFVLCAKDGVCKVAKAGDAQGKCVASAGAGTACSTDAAVGPKCNEGLSCVSGTCKALDPGSCK